MLRQQRELLTTGESNLYRAVEEGKTLSGAEVIYLLEAIKAARACSDEWERQWNDAYEGADDDRQHANDRAQPRWRRSGRVVDAARRARGSAMSTAQNPKGTKTLAWCPRLNAPATICHHDGCTHYLIDATTGMAYMESGRESDANLA